MSVDSWYDPGAARHLNDDEVASLASGGGQVSPLASQHYSECDECRRAVTRYEKSNWYGSSGGIHPFRNRIEEDPEEAPFFSHLSYDEARAIAAGNWQHVNPRALQHYKECDECRRDVARAEKNLFAGY